MSLADVHVRAQRFQSRIRTRNFIEYAAAALVIGVFGWMTLIIPEPAVQTGAVLIMLGALYVCWQLHRLGRAATRDERNAAAHSWTDFHRDELTRQRDALRSVWRWYLAPFLPGVLVFLGAVAFTTATDTPLPERLGLFLGGVGMTAVLFAAIAWLNAVAARRLDAELAALDKAREG
ncbi:MAG: hypothetical protein H7124_13065 [Phycisphaerales bacterium]|nr:hypothetical protein [Hyphomonadaceae bacterium]